MFTLLDAPAVPEMGSVELIPDDDLSLHVNAFVRYCFRGVDSFYGSVVSIDEAGRVEVLDEDGGRSWCAADRLQLILVPEAAAVGVEGRMG